MCCTAYSKVEPLRLEIVGRAGWYNHCFGLPSPVGKTSMTDHESDPAAALATMIPSYLLHLRKDGASRPDLLRAFSRLDGALDAAAINAALDRLVRTPVFAKNAPKNRGGRPPTTEDMATFFIEREGKASHKERAAEWRQRYPNDPRTAGRSLLEIKERLREAARRHYKDKRRGQAQKTGQT